MTIMGVSSRVCQIRDDLVQAVIGATPPSALPGGTPSPGRGRRGWRRRWPVWSVQERRGRLEVVVPVEAANLDGDVGGDFNRDVVVWIESAKSTGIGLVCTTDIDRTGR